MDKQRAQAQEDPALDFLSASFDPALALATPGLQPPCPEALPLDNVSRCRAILPPEMPESLSNLVKKKASEESKLKGQQLKERAARLTERVQGSCSMSLDKVLSSVKPGPIRVLGQWLQAGQRVRVVTRHGRGVRGVATGHLVAYDRFMNVVLRDVDEAYTVRVRVEREVPRALDGAQAGAARPSADAGLGEAGDAAEPTTKVRWSHRQDHRQRHLAQIFIKGDNVVIMSAEQQQQQQQPGLSEGRTSAERAGDKAPAAGASRSGPSRGSQ